MSKASGEADLLHSLVARIREFCRTHAEERIITKYAKFFREGFDAYGVDPDLRGSESDRMLKEHRASLGFAGFLDLADRLMASGKYEEACFAIHFVNGFRKEYTLDAFERLGDWFDGKVLNWAISDSICGGSLSYLLSQSIIRLDDFAPWRASSNKWKRRAVPVTMLILLTGEFDIRHLLRFIGSMMMDEERVVHQGLGWFLREAWRKSPSEVDEFLAEWKDTAARLIFQYATEKMTAEQRSRFRRAKAAK
jgi:3-methyladenine DNA glycosylase AlkD